LKSFNTKLSEGEIKHKLNFYRERFLCVTEWKKHKSHYKQHKSPRGKNAREGDRSSLGERELNIQM
jgi:hypothetical protein